jgi:hypothetical protein
MRRAGTFIIACTLPTVDATARPCYFGGILLHAERLSKRGFNATLSD